MHKDFMSIENGRTNTRHYYVRNYSELIKKFYNYIYRVADTCAAIVFYYAASGSLLLKIPCATNLFIKIISAADNHELLDQKEC